MPKEKGPGILSKKELAEIERVKAEIDSISSIERAAAQPSTEISQSDIDLANKEIELDEKYGNNTGEALVTGAARGVVPGFDMLATQLGMDPERLREVKDRQPIASALGEAGGLVGGAIASGGSSAGAKLTLGGAMAVTERKVAKEIGEELFKTAAEKSIGRKIVEKGIEQSAAAGLTGAGFEINTLVNEAALGEADLTGENLVAYAGAGALLNGLVGGAFGSAEALLPVAKQALDKSTGQLKKVFRKEADFDRSLSELISPTTAGRKSAYESLTAEGVDGTAKFTPEFKTNYVRDEWGMKLGDSTDAMRDKHIQLGDRLGTSLENSYKSVDQIAPRGVVPTSEAHLELQSAVGQFIRENANKFDNAAAKNVANQVQNELEARLKRVGRGKFESANDFLEAARNWGKKGFDETDTLKAEIYKVVNRRAREVLYENAERVAAGTPKQNIVQEIKDLNKKFEMWYTVEKGIHNKAASDPGFLGFKDSIMGLLGGVAGGPAGVVGAVLSGKALNSDLRRKFVVLNTADRANNMAAKKVAGSIKSFFDKTGRAAVQVARTAPKVALVNSGFSVGEKRKKPENEKEAFKNISKNIIEFRVNPDKLAMKIAAGTMNAGYAAPNASKFAQLVLGKAVSFLYEKMPKDGQAGMHPLDDREFQPSSMDMSKFKRYVQTVENPYSVLEDLQAGTLTKEHVETLQIVYPAIYQQMRNEAMKYVAQKPKLDYSRKVQLGTLLNIPTDPSMQPKAIAALQMNFAPKQEESGGAVNPTVGGTQKINKSNRMQSAAQEGAQGIEE